MGIQTLCVGNGCLFFIIFSPFWHWEVFIRFLIHWAVVFLACFLTEFQNGCNSDIFLFWRKSFDRIACQNVFLSDVEIWFWIHYMELFETFRAIIYFCIWFWSPELCSLFSPPFLEWYLSLTLTLWGDQFANCCWEDLIWLMAKMASKTAPFLGHSMIFCRKVNAAFGCLIWCYEWFVCPLEH